jgi:hypothetical protein
VGTPLSRSAAAGLRERRKGRRRRKRKVYSKQRGEE